MTIRDSICVLMGKKWWHFYKIYIVFVACFLIYLAMTDLMWFGIWSVCLAIRSGTLKIAIGEWVI